MKNQVLAHPWAFLIRRKTASADAANEALFPNYVTRRPSANESGSRAFPWNGLNLFSAVHKVINFTCPSHDDLTLVLIKSNLREDCVCELMTETLQFANFRGHYDLTAWLCRRRCSCRISDCMRPSNKRTGHCCKFCSFSPSERQNAARGKSRKWGSHWREGERERE